MGSYFFIITMSTRYIKKSFNFDVSQQVISLNAVYSSENKRMYTHSIDHPNIELCLLSNGVQISEYHKDRTTMDDVYGFIKENEIDLNDVLFIFVDIFSFNDEMRDLFGGEAARGSKFIKWAIAR